jgi:hypothetical protein
MSTFWTCTGRASSLRPGHNDHVDLDALLLTEEAAALAKVSEDVIRHWAHRYPDALPVRARHWQRNRPLYRAGDVIEVEHATRRHLR